MTDAAGGGEAPAGQCCGPAGEGGRDTSNDAGMRPRPAALPCRREHAE